MLLAPPSSGAQSGRMQSAEIYLLILGYGHIGGMCIAAGMNVSHELLWQPLILDT